MMKTLGYFGFAFLIVLVGLTLVGFNSSQQAANRVDARLGDLAGQYQRRADLIPNLVSTVEAAASHETEVMEGVTRLRTAQRTAEASASGAQYEAGQRAVSQGLAHLLVTVENYPALRANESFLQLQAQIEGTENRIAVARRDVNLAVNAYNNEVDSFPSVIGARMRGLTHRASFQTTTAGASDAVPVRFHAPAAH